MKLTIILPIRDRDQELMYYLEHMTPIFTSQDITPQFIVVKQVPGRPFNKGMLNNIGYLEVIKTKCSKKILFNDIDILPDDPLTIDYRHVKTITNPYGYTHCLGCFFLIRRKVFKKMNGFSNLYFGWGYEDTDLQQRAKLYDINIDRPQFAPRYGSPKMHDINTGDTQIKVKASLTTTKPTYLNIWGNSDKKQLTAIVQGDGLSNCKYEVISVTPITGYNATIYTVRI
jgi:hypothetical protein